MKTVITNKIRQFDYLFNNLYLKLIGEKKSLLIFLFHVIFLNEKESSTNAVCPMQGLTLKHFREFVEYYLNQNYSFISGDDILNGLDESKNYALITFDDGYYNNRHVLPILKQYEIPAIFFISTDYIKNNRSFWWDVLYRNNLKLGISTEAALKEINFLTTSWTIEKIEAYITDKFGKNAFNPIGDIDRPFTPRELNDFAKEKFVFLGNHTSEHAYLANCSEEKIKSTIINAQNELYNITGLLPRFISYPHGAYTQEVIKLTKQIGLRLAMAVDNKKNTLPIEPETDSLFRLGRFALRETDQMISQCQLCRTDIRLTKIIKHFMGKGQ